MSRLNERVEALFQAAVALETEAQRADYLNRACPDPELRREVESLLAAHGQPDPLLATRLRSEASAGQARPKVPGRPTIKLDFPDAQGEAATIPKPPAPAFDVADVARHFPQLEILELLGQGGMGVVFKARQPQLDRLVALKIMLPEFAKDPRFAERFTREARALAKLNHPNIVAVYEFGQAGKGDAAAAPGFFYFLMEYVDGANLRAMLQGGHLRPEQAFAIVPKICDALQFAHDEGIMHRDIKPENILIDKKSRVKIADFGLAKILGRETAKESITVTGAGMGTPKYMAPEQIENAKTVDHRADIYSLGVVFYEMLTGELPLGRFAPPSQKVQVDVRLDEVVLHTLEKEPARRYQHASELKTDVESITSPVPPGTPKAADRTDGRSASESDAPRFSRKAIWGAIWVGGIPLSAIGWQGLLRPVYEGGAPAEPWRMILGWLGVFLGLTGSIGTTLLGFMAIHEIRHSRGRIVGLPLAFVDAILFPLGAIGLGIGWIVQETLAATFNVRPTTRMEGPAGLVALVVCFFSARAIWHALADREKPSQPARLPAVPPLAPAPGQPENWLGDLSLWTAIGGVALVFLLAFVASMFASVTESFFVLCWALGVVLALVALGCGIVARRTATGKTGLIISGILVVLYIVVCLAVFPLFEAPSEQPQPAPTTLPELPR